MRDKEIVKGGYYLKGNKVLEVVEIIPNNQGEPLVKFATYDKQGNKEKEINVEYLYYFAWSVDRRVQPKKHPIDKAVDNYLTKRAKQRYQQALDRYGKEY